MLSKPQPIHSEDTHPSDGHFDAHDFDLDDWAEPQLKDMDYMLGERTLVVTEAFYNEDAIAIAHNPDRIFSDIIPSLPTQSQINLSSPLVLSVSKYIGNIEDLYAPVRGFRVAELFTRTPKTPHFRSVSVTEPLPFLSEESIDIRNSEILKSPVQKYPDIYETPLNIGRKIRRIHRQFGVRILRYGLIAVAVVVLLLTFIFGLALVARDAAVRGYERVAELRMDTPEARFIELRDSAKSEFSQAKIAFAPIELLTSILYIHSGKIADASHAIDAGNTVTNLLSEVDVLRAQLRGWLSPADTQNLRYFDTRLLTHSSVGFTDALARESRALENLRVLTGNAAFHFSSISTTGSSEQDVTLKKINSLLNFWDGLLQSFETSKEPILTLLGHKKPMHYLVLNQNRDELRANGGFPGSAVEVTLYKGRIEKYEKRDIYFYDWHLFPYGSTPPAGINQVTKVYGIRDANYDPDFRKSFETIATMFETAGGGTLDGAIAINQGLIERILQLIPPLQVEGIREPITADNFSLLLSVLVEGQYARTTSAKDILFKVVEQLEETLRNQWEYSAYGSVVQEEIAKGEILFALRNNELQSFWEGLSTPKKVWEWSSNFIEPVFTSLSGNKSDRYMQRDFALRSTPINGCSFLNRVTLKSTHTMTVGDVENVRNLLYRYAIPLKNHEQEIAVQGNGENRHYVRWLIPKWSKLLTDSINPKLNPIEIPTLDTSDPRFDMITQNIRTLVGRTSEYVIDYQSTPKNCTGTLEFVAPPGMRHFTITR